MTRRADWEKAARRDKALLDAAVDEPRGVRHFNKPLKGELATRYHGVAPEWREITAKLAGVCGLCGGRILVGERVCWQKGRRNARHPACHDSKTAREVKQ